MSLFILFSSACYFVTQCISRLSRLSPTNLQFISPQHSRISSHFLHQHIISGQPAGNIARILLKTLVLGKLLHTCSLTLILKSFSTQSTQCLFAFLMICDISHLKTVTKKMISLYLLALTLLYKSYFLAQLVKVLSV